MPVALLKVEEMLQAFADVIESHDYLEIDGVPEDENTIKVLNHDKKSAYGVSVEAIMEQELGKVIEALETGETIKLRGFTRIVGYYSQIRNWNKSKLGELADRHKGNYSVIQGKVHGVTA